MAAATPRTSDEWRAVLSARRQHIVDFIKWEEDKFIVKLKAKVITEKEFQTVKDKRLNNRGYALLDILKQKSRREFDNFLRILSSDKRYSRLARELECLLKAKCNIDQDIKDRATEMIEKGLRDAPVKIADKKVLTREVAELAQVQKIMGAAETKDMERKLNSLQNSLHEITQGMVNVIDPGRSTPIEGDAIDCLEEYASALTDMVKDLEVENEKLKCESEALNKSLRGQIQSLTSELATAREKLADAQKALERMEADNAELRRQIQDLRKKLKEKDRQIANVQQQYNSQARKIYEIETRQKEQLDEFRAELMDMKRKVDSKEERAAPSWNPNTRKTDKP